MERGILVFNPTAGNHSIPHKLDYIIKRFQEENILIQPYRLVDEQSVKLADVLKGHDFKYVVVSGGDGTLNYVANIILKNRLDLPLGIIPAGTCNDFAGNLNLPTGLKDCIDIILSGRTTFVDTGLVNEDRYFLSTCAGGLFVNASFKTHSELKKNFGTLAYYLKALSEMGNIKPFSVQITMDNGTIEEEVFIFLIINGKHAAGFSNIVESADTSDGIMDILLIKKCLPLDLASMFFKVLSNISLNDRNVLLLRASSCSVKSNSDVVLSIDGEKGPELPIDVRFENRVLRVFSR